MGPIQRNRVRRVGPIGDLPRSETSLTACRRTEPYMKTSDG